MKILLALLAMLSFSSHAQIVPQTFTPLYCVGYGITFESSCPTSAPLILFTDIDSGPDTGLGDGTGSGTIVTVWGQNLGEVKNTSTIDFTDSTGTKRECVVYYWKNADGQLPSGPANLYESHGMQEIACSIPDSAQGLGNIKVNVDGVDSNSLPFTVRPGNIYFVHASGDNANDCSWSNPCATIDGGINPTQSPALGNDNLDAGDIVYSRGVTEFGSSGGGVSVGMFLRNIVGTRENPISIIAYPNTLAAVSSENRGINPFNSEHFNISKYHITVGHVDDTEAVGVGGGQTSNYHIRTQQGRYTGNLLDQFAGKCFTGELGAIVTNGTQADGAFMAGNQLSNLGCDNGSKFAHCFYISNRQENISITAPQVVYNYLNGCNVKNGIHFYDETTVSLPTCSWNMTGTIKIKNNVIVNQRGAGINVQAADVTGDINECWTANVEIVGNVLVNVGKGKPQEQGDLNPRAIVVGGNAFSPTTVLIENNTVLGYGDADSLGGTENAYALDLSFGLVDPAITVQNNVFVQTLTHPRMNWLNTSETITADNNAFWNTVTQDANTPPDWNNNVTTDPLITFEDGKIVMGDGSPLLSANIGIATQNNLYGKEF